MDSDRIRNSKSVCVFVFVGVGVGVYACVCVCARATNKSRIATISWDLGHMKDNSDAQNKRTSMGAATCNR